MKVCLLNDSFPPVIDGVVNVVMNYASHMQSMGAEVIVGTPRYPDADYSSYPYKVIPYPSLDTTSIASGYRTGNPLSAKAIADLAAFGPDLIHTHCPASATVAARLLREETQAPVVFTYHTKYDIDIERCVKVRQLAQEGIRLMVGNIEACDEVWVVSRGAGESLKALGFQGDYRVMHNGVDFVKGRVDPETVYEVTKAYDLPQGVPVFLFVGRLMTYKGLPLILDALKMVSDRGMDFRMVFVGKGPDQELLEKQAEDLGIRKKCIFAGPEYDRDRLRAWNTRADLFLFPSTFDTNGLVVREAAACGLASVLIRDSCAAEDITDGRNGFTIEETPQAMAELLLTASRDLDHLHDVGQHAMDEIYLSWKDCVEEVYGHYHRILETKKSGLLVPRKKQLTDHMVSAAALGMEERTKMRRIRRELFNDFKDTAIGMMENIQDASEQAELLHEKIRQEIEEVREEVRERGHQLKNELQEREEKAERRLEQLSTRHPFRKE